MIIPCVLCLAENSESLQVIWKVCAWNALLPRKKCPSHQSNGNSQTVICTSFVIEFRTKFPRNSHQSLVMSFVAEISLILETSFTLKLPQETSCHPMDVCGHVSFVQFETYFFLAICYIYPVYRDRDIFFHVIIFNGRKHNFLRP